jgi:O-acetyl-ADP-ribose deacetylase (regulator of RNase III)
MAVALTLCDRSEEMVRAWQRYFPLDLGVRIVKGNILTLPVEALAVPANSFGYTDGGIDLTISREIFDWRLQERLRAVIDRQYAGELLVGQALVMATGSDRFRYVVVAPTMRVPGDVSATINAYLAMRGILLAVEAHNQKRTVRARAHSFDCSARIGDRRRQDAARTIRVPDVHCLPQYCPERPGVDQIA